MTQPISRRRRWISIVVLIAAALVGGGYVIETNTRPQLLRGPMVHIPGPDTLAITWKAESFFGSARVELITATGAVREVRAQSNRGWYEARFSGLAPGQAYIYRVFNRGLIWHELSGPNAVSTPAPRGDSIRFVAFGDSGNGSNSQASLADLIARSRPDVVIHVGDLVYPAGAMKDYAVNFFEPNAALIRSVPFMPSLGNHDVQTDGGQPLLDAFVLPENGPEGIPAERCYAFDYGDARFVALDSNPADQKGVITAEQMKTEVAPWLRRVLTDCDARWKFVFFHHPFYTGSTHRPEGVAYLKEAFVDVFEETGVDIVFCGHNHLYERTAPIRKDRAVPNGHGVVYVTTGAGGVSRYPEQDPPPPYIEAYNDEVFSFTQVDVSDDRLVLHQIDENGQTIDEYSISKPEIDSIRDYPKTPREQAQEEQLRNSTLFETRSRKAPVEPPPPLKDNE